MIIDTEREVVGELQAALSQGGWLNTDVEHGDYANYQDAASIDASGLESVLQTHGEFITEAGRWVSHWCAVVVRLRGVVRTALEDRTKERWQTVQEVVQDIVSLVGGTTGLENAALHDHLCPSSFAEFVAARKECAYQLGGHDVLVQLQHTRIQRFAQSIQVNKAVLFRSHVLRNENIVQFGQFLMLYRLTS